MIQSLFLPKNPKNEKPSRRKNSLCKEIVVPKLKKKIHAYVEYRQK